MEAERPKDGGLVRQGWDLCPRGLLLLDVEWEGGGGQGPLLTLMLIRVEWKGQFAQPRGSQAVRFGECPSSC